MNNNKNSKPDPFEKLSIDNIKNILLKLTPQEQLSMINKSNKAKKVYINYIL